MRHLFDQYSDPENKVTHALISSLANDNKLLRDFIRWSVKDVFLSKEKLYITEQSIPGKAELEENEAGECGLPDAWIYTNKGWVLLIENKISAHLKIPQLKRHIYTAERHGFMRPKLLVIDVLGKKHIPFSNIYRKTWEEVYEWGRSHFNKSKWADLFTSYLEVAEEKMVKKKYLKEGTLTRFTGIPFNADNPYSYFEAKRILGLVMKELKGNKKLIKKLGIAPDLPSRAAITGQYSSCVWDYLRVKESKNAQAFTKQEDSGVRPQH